MKCKPVPLTMLKVGAVLRAPVMDLNDGRIKLLAEDTEISESFLRQLAVRGIDSVILSQRDIATLAAFSPQGRRRKVPPAHDYVQSKDANDYSESLDESIEPDSPLTLPATDLPVASEINKPSDCAYADGLPIEWARESDRRIDLVNEFLDDTANGDSSGIGPLYVACFELLDRIAEDQDALMCLACAPYDSDYPSRHGIHLATVAIAIGVEMGLDRSTLAQLGVGCLIHDVGMREVGLRMFDTKRSLSAGQLKRLADHPVKAIEIAGEYGDCVSDLVRFVVYQIHERCDGSGYPRGRCGDEIHPLAKIAAVADAFVGMLANRKHRLAIQGYFAITQLLEEMKQRKFDAKVIRSLLQATSLYPIGSYVKLDNDCIGRVIRSGGNEFVRPTIEMWHHDHPDRKPAIVNLKLERQIRITDSIPAARAA